MAEAVSEVLPEAVTCEESGVDARAIDSVRLVEVLIEALKEQQAQIEELKARVNALTAAKKPRPALNP